jgi:hypothetical protein
MEWQEEWEGNKLCQGRYTLLIGVGRIGIMQECLKQLCYTAESRMVMMILTHFRY